MISFLRTLGYTLKKTDSLIINQFSFDGSVTQEDLELSSFSKTYLERKEDYKLLLKDNTDVHKKIDEIIIKSKKHNALTSVVINAELTSRGYELSLTFTTKRIDNG